MKQAFTKDGVELRGLLESVAGCAVVEGVEDNGDIIYAGETDIWWDEQHTVERGGQRVWLDHEGNEYLESEVEYREATDN